MKLSLTLSTLLLLLPIVVEAHSSHDSVLARQNRNSRQFGRQRGGGGGGNKNDQNKNKNNNATAAATTSSAAPAATVNPTGQAQSGKVSGDAQTSLQLDPSQVQSGLAQDGQAVPAAGQVASKTSVNNFINFCATVDLPLTNGQQVIDGSCNPTIMGVIVAKSKMPSSKFQNPKNLDTIKENTAFTIEMRINNLETGFFVNAQQNYFAAPAFVNGQGILQGHSHVVIEKIDSLTTTTVTNPTEFAFFKGFNAKAENGILTADVTAGLPAGTYRMGSINTAANHQPAIVAVAQHGMLDDAVYFTVNASGTPDGGAGNNTGNSQQDNGQKDAQADAQKDAQKDAQADTGKNVQVDAGKNAQTGAPKNAQTNVQKNAQGKKGQGNNNQRKRPNSFNRGGRPRGFGRGRSRGRN